MDIAALTGFAAQLIPRARQLKSGLICRHRTFSFQTPIREGLDHLLQSVTRILHYLPAVIRRAVVPSDEAALAQRDFCLMCLGAAGSFRVRIV
ncbi:hypothetical protein ELI_10895 [Erythrobacter litoralis HTCC2594]|uniref:Uncharacterized protein n=1 Tax=Erythrobacter litoralis (strain HTCC2594) TaxID=314225 RepID=Q2N7S0_ERYLH|nr:hypothetical protein ELI_10895 [Erythrobacter litoralis HTCC2594]